MAAMSPSASIAGATTTDNSITSSSERKQQQQQQQQDPGQGEQVQQQQQSQQQQQQQQLLRDKLRQLKLNQQQQQSQQPQTSSPTVLPSQLHGARKSALSPSPSASSLRKPSLSPVRNKKTMGGGDVGGLRKNRISFGSNTVAVFEKEIEEEEHKNAVWYNKKEMKSIRKDLKKSIKKGDITRGLEQYGGENMGATNKQKRLNHIKSILALQNAQRDAGIRDDIGLGSLSKSLSADNLRQARRLASLDSTEALEEYNDLPKEFIEKTTNIVATSTMKNATFGRGTNKISSAAAAAFLARANDNTSSSSMLKDEKRTTKRKNPGLRRSQKSTPNMFLKTVDMTSINNYSTEA